MYVLCAVHIFDDGHYYALNTQTRITTHLKHNNDVENQSIQIYKIVLIRKNMCIYISTYITNTTYILHTKQYTPTSFTVFFIHTTNRKPLILF